MAQGPLCLVLHTHLPYVRHPEYENFLEESWLFGALTESYIPLIRIFDNLILENIDFRLTISLSPTLLCMLKGIFVWATARQETSGAANRGISPMK